MKLNKLIFKILYIMLIILIIVSVFLYIQVNSLKVSKYTISSNKIPIGFDGYKILQLSDLHSKEFGRNNKILLDRIIGINPDIILVTGDMLNSVNDSGEVFTQLSKGLNKRYPIYYCEGNHERIARIKAESKKSGWFNEYIKRLEDLGVKYINNETVEIRNNEDTIKIYGLSMPLLYYSASDVTMNNNPVVYGVKDIQKSLGTINKAYYNILLSHNPKYFNTYCEWGADLTFSGHIHGGIIQIPFLGGLLSPDQTLFPEYDAGIFSIDESKLIVNRGLGLSGIMIRILNRPDITVVKLKSEQN